MKLNLETKNGESDFYIGYKFDFIEDLIGNRESIFIVDSNVLEVYGNLLEKWDIINIGNGEKIKTLKTVTKIYHRFMEKGVDRSWLIVGMGGGVITDITGFVASTFMRGVPFAFIPTTLLAMVDASIGGKNGVDFDGYKNLIGTIKQPLFCLIDVNFLKSLPFRELISGIAEIVKAAIIADKDLFEFLEKEGEEILRLNNEKIKMVISRAVAIKVAIVQRDENENLERMKLNFGHTIGHAIESVTGLPHGHAISIGMVMESEISKEMGYIDEQEFNRIKNLLEIFKLPTSLKVERDSVFKFMLMDKKRRGNVIGLPVIKGIGDSQVELVPFDKILQTIRRNL